MIKERDSLADDGDQNGQGSPSDPAASRLECWRLPDRDERVYRLTISGGDLMRARLSAVDRKVLAACESDDATVADKLLGLELLVRRIEEAQRA